MSNGDGGGGFDFGSFFDGLLGELGAIVQAIIQFLFDLVAALVQVLNFLFTLSLDIFAFSFDGLGDIVKILTKVGGDIWRGVILVTLKNIWNAIQTIQRWAARLKAWLDRFHALQQKYQVQAFRRIINLIQRARQILVVFRLLHLKFATKLDAWLGDIEAKLIRREHDIALKTNEIIAWVNLVADPTTLFRQVPYLRSLGRTIRDFLRSLRALGLNKFFPWLDSVLGPGVAVRSWQDTARQFRLERRTITGDYAAARAQFLQTKELFAQDIGGPLGLGG